MSEDQLSQDQNASALFYPPKPILHERGQNAITRSLIGLLIYAVLFYFLFDQNIAYIAAILLVIVIHEMGHFLFMRLFDYRNVKMFIVPLLGAFTNGKKQTVSQGQLSLIILAGPVPGIIIGTLLFWLNIPYKDPTISMLANSFLIINLLNCLPIYPLDGGRLIETLFFKENHLIRLIFGIISIVALLVMFLFILSPVMLIIPVLIGLELFNENKHQKIREYLKAEKINYFTEYQNLPDKDYWLIRDCIILSFQKKYAGVVAGKLEYSVMEPVLIQHLNAILQINIAFDLNTFKRLLILFFYILCFVVPVFIILLNR